MLEFQNMNTRPSRQGFEEPDARLLALALSTSDEGEPPRDKTIKDTGEQAPGPEKQPPETPREKPIAEAFDDLEAEEKEKVKRLLDRMIGRKP